MAYSIYSGNEMIDDYDEEIMMDRSGVEEAIQRVIEPYESSEDDEPPFSAGELAVMAVLRSTKGGTRNKKAKQSAKKQRLAWSYRGVRQRYTFGRWRERRSWLEQMV